MSVKVVIYPGHGTAIKVSHHFQLNLVCNVEEVFFLSKQLLKDARNIYCAATQVTGKVIVQEHHRRCESL